ncbi:PDDEXK nuclease domain-containing protein [Collinsella sp. BM28]|uniref:PDDEXK nuclease domain-containing protein n=1 Tax=Collinsella sp. BM28 TaxID=3378285 RepID=UPI0038912956
MLELGTGFAFVGRQYHLAVGGEDFYIDLLFYNVMLHSYIVVASLLSALSRHSWPERSPGPPCAALQSKTPQRAWRSYEADE